MPILPRLRVKLSSLPLVEPVPAAPSTLIEPASRNSDTYSHFATKTKLAANPPETLVQKPQPDKTYNLGTWEIFSSTFLTIFLAEMGDKTQLTTLLMSAQSQSPWIVFIGAAAAMVATSLIGVLIGRWLANRLSPKTLKTAAGILLLFISMTLLWDVVQLGS